MSIFRDKYTDFRFHKEYEKIFVYYLHEIIARSIIKVFCPFLTFKKVKFTYLLILKRSDSVHKANVHLITFVTDIANLLCCNATNPIFFY